MLKMHDQIRKGDQPKIIVDNFYAKNLCHIPLFHSTIDPQ